MFDTEILKDVLIASFAFMSVLHLYIYKKKLLMLSDLFFGLLMGLSQASVVRSLYISGRLSNSL